VIFLQFSNCAVHVASQRRSKGFGAIKDLKRSLEIEVFYSSMQGYIDDRRLWTLHKYWVGSRLRGCESNPDGTE